MRNERVNDQGVRIKKSHFRKWAKHRQISNPKIALNDSFAHNLICYYAQSTIFF